MAPKFTNSHKKILYQFKEKEVIYQKKIRQLHSSLIFGGNHPDIGLTTRDFLLFRDIKIINKEIRQDNVKIISGLDEESGETCYMLVNRNCTQSNWILDVGSYKYSEGDKLELYNVAYSILNSEQPQGY